jgi:hypothetical protein
MNTKDILASATDLVSAVSNLDDLLLLESKVKELIKTRKEDFKEAVKTQAKTLKETAKVEIRSKMSDADIGRMVEYTFGSGKAQEVRTGKLLRAPSADHPTFSVEADDGKGGTKKLPRNATAFIKFVA